MILKGNNVILRPVNERDSQIVYKWFNDDEVIRGLVNIRAQMSLKEAYDWCERAARSSSESIKWMIEIKDKPSITVGFTGLYNIDFTNRNAESAILIGDKRYWGIGIGYESLKLKLDFSFKYLGFKLVYAFILQSNKASIKLYEKLGFEREGLLRKRIYRDNKWNNLILLSLLKSKWEK